jgi:hypothetical protein
MANFIFGGRVVVREGDQCMNLGHIGYLYGRVLPLLLLGVTQSLSSGVAPPTPPPLDFRPPRNNEEVLRAH